MLGTSDHVDPWAALVVVLGVLAALIVFVLTSDVVRTAVPLLLTVAVVRHLGRRRGHTV